MIHSTRTDVRSDSPIAPNGATRNIAAVVQDLITLIELQGQLLLADYRESKRRIILGASAAAIGALLLMAALPVALLALAALLMNLGCSAPSAYGLSALVAAAAASVAAWLGWRLARSGVMIFSRSRDELMNNLDTLKCQLGASER